MRRYLIPIAMLLLLALVLGACGSSQPAATQAPAEQPAATTAPAEQPTQPPAAQPTEEKAQEEPTQAPEPTEAPQEEAETGPKVLKIANTANITTWDPIKSFSTEAAYMANMYEQLLRINPPDAEERFTPLLAESWEKSEDGTVWTFYLRKGVKFHDGEPLTSEAVKMSIEAAATRGGASFIWAPLDTIETPDDYTVVFNLKYAAPLDLIASSLYGAWIVSPKALKAAEENPDYFEQGVDAGTGPYMLESYMPDQEILFTKYDDYWGGWDDKKFDKVLVQIVPEAITQQQMLEGGEVDLVTRIPQENYDAFRENPNYEVLTEPSFFNYVGFFNTLRPPLDNVKVRQALSYATPYQDIIDIGAKGLGTQSRGPVPKGVWPWSEKVKQYTFDMDKAKQLMAEAGYPDGGFRLVLTYAAENATEEAFAPLLKDAWGELGVDVELKPMLFNQQWEWAKSDPPNAQDVFLLLYWPTYSDAGADNLWSMFHSSEKPFFNLSYWKNEKFDQLVDDAIAKTVTDPETAQQEYIEAMNLLVDEAPGLFFFDTMAIFIIPDYIKGFQYNLNYPFVQYFFYDLYTE